MTVKLRKITREYDLLFILLLLLVIMAAKNPGAFFNSRNIASILRLSTIVGIATIGEGLVLLVKDVDLSVGAVMGLVSILTAVILQTSGILTAVVVSLLICAVIGFINGLFIVKGKIPAIITTLGMMWFLRGISGAITSGRLIRITNETFISLSSLSLWNIVPYFFIVLLILGIIAIFTLSKLDIGRHIYAIGGDERAAYYSGINVSRVKITVFMIAAVMYGISGLLLSSYIRCGMPFAAEGYEFRAITAAALGGIALSGGRGKIWKVIPGALILTILYNLITSFAISPYLQGLFEGTILIGAVYICQRN